MTQVHFEKKEHRVLPLAVEPTFSWLSPSVLSGFHEDLPVLNLYSRVERGTVRGKCFAQQHNTVTWPELEPRPLDPSESLLGHIHLPHLVYT